ncbi:hypothetical protein P3X46_025994 [Hevea brasiliensis]|uniref:Auxin-responsive protein n=1 Tax=Hevea brasiliensis TaxID=3981 RepID=A0ABQ9KVL3_HEVBR|nr:hypothetical protein P3X46_025994 [Hevea brasiliensis]
MISAKKLLKLAEKWQKMAAIRRRGMTLPQTFGSIDTSNCSTSLMAEKGHFIVYSADGKCFLLPLGYLNNEIIKELFNMAEAEFGLQSKRPLILPCGQTLWNLDVERALLVSIAINCCSSSFYFQHQTISHQLPICSF